MKKTNKNPYAPVDKQKSNKRYLARKIQEQEAEEEIKKYENSADESGADRFDGLGHFGGQRSSRELS